ncbi:uncharacterized protein ALTATR162_LOCUS8259 [Alternaria atra]|uniref:Protein YOP1 n=1 Tax=Alternaria atra TaxID=119953 RepID=A0A8J2I6V7_9PLEO|nr:uncharacterized protein ALTATR162_LOCUS8259 [Alternaria atra]CAG5175967.1 unnamed protein product [Alternaria atra]
MSVQDRAQAQLSQLDKEFSYEATYTDHVAFQLSKYPALNNFEKQTSVPKVYMILGLAEFLVNIAGFIIPGYYSLEALFSASKVDDTQWLTYWVTFAFLTVFESAVNAVYWFPFYYTFKFVLILWMALPQTSGAQIVFRSFLQPVFSRYFSTSGSTAADLRAKADSAGKTHAS